MNSSKFVAWPHIGKLHDAQKNARGATIAYRAKVKLHGTNAAVRIEPDGTVTAQSRNRDLRPDDDNFGFAQFVKERADAFRKHGGPVTVVLFGEWVGPGVQKGVALAQIPEKHFAVFAVVACDLVGERFDADAFSEIPGVSPLQWTDGDPYTFDFMSSDNDAVLERINSEVEAIDKLCPWTLKRYGISGPGEGLVFYPQAQSGSMLTLKQFSQLAFKAKGETHRTAGKRAVSLRAAATPDIVEFVNSVLTPARLEQGVYELAQFGITREPAHTSQFLKWVGNDVQRECAGELEASGLEWKQVSKILAGRAAKWFTAA